MPYFISQNTDCPDWAVVKEDGSVVSCQDSKDSAIAQMVALSLAEELEPGGELRATTRELPDNYRPARTQLGITSIYFILFNVNRGKHIILN